jgi:hypothetical protein
MISNISQSSAGAATSISYVNNNFIWNSNYVRDNSYISQGTPISYVNNNFLCK